MNPPQVYMCSNLLYSQLLHPYMTIGKTIFWLARPGLFLCFCAPICSIFVVVVVV